MRRIIYVGGRASRGCGIIELDPYLDKISARIHIRPTKCYSEDKSQINTGVVGTHYLSCSLF